jgi:hypothetical protein
MKLAMLTIAALLAPAWGQTIPLPAGLERLGAKASETVEVTLDKAMLRLTSRFLSDRGEEARARRAMDGLESVYVRSYTFDRDGEYNPADLDAFRAQFQSPSWTRIVGVRSRESGENVDVLLKGDPNGQIGGALVISMQPRELTIVHITGTLDPNRLADLGGQLHIPHLAWNGVRR